VDLRRFPKDFFRHTWVDLPGEIVITLRSDAGTDVRGQVLG
jgi:hypothetical protein